MQANNFSRGGFPDLLDDLKLLEDAARTGGEIARSYFGKAPRQWTKEHDSPVSEADMAVDRHLFEYLTHARSAYGWLSEETIDDPRRLECQRVFVVDPIDGTRGFLSGSEEWTVSLAVVENGRPVAAALFCPLKNEMYLAAEEQGATLNGRRISIMPPAGLRGAKVAGPKPVLDLGAMRQTGLLQANYIPSLAYRLAKVADGRLDVAVARGRASDWDLAASDLLVQEAGGRLIDLEGRGLSYNRPETRHPGLIAAHLDLLDPLKVLFAGSL